MTPPELRTTALAGELQALAQQFLRQPGTSTGSFARGIGEAVRLNRHSPFPPWRSLRYCSKAKREGRGVLGDRGAGERRKLDPSSSNKIAPRSPASWRAANSTAMKAAGTSASRDESPTYRTGLGTLARRDALRGLPCAVWRPLQARNAANQFDQLARSSRRGPRGRRAASVELAGFWRRARRGGLAVAWILVDRARARRDWGGRPQKRESIVEDARNAVQRVVAPSLVPRQSRHRVRTRTLPPREPPGARRHSAH